MKIIMLKGPNNSGKTMTLNLVYDELVNNRQAKIIEPRTAISNNDFSCLLEYKGLKVAIFSMGDYVKDINSIWNAIKNYTNKSADVLIIANSNKLIPETSMRQHNYVLIIKMKALVMAPIIAPVLQEAENKVYMQQIIDLI